MISLIDQVVSQNADCLPVFLLFQRDRLIPMEVTSPQGWQGLFQSGEIHMESGEVK